MTGVLVLKQRGAMCSLHGPVIWKFMSNRSCLTDISRNRMDNETGDAVLYSRCISECISERG